MKIRHTAVPSRRRSRSERALTAALVVSTFAVYLRTSARALTGEDAGELVTAAYELGIPHPPGYPLWCLLAKAFTWIPIGSVAFRVSLLSAVFGSLASLLLFAYFRTFQVRPLLAAAAAGLFAFSRTFWSQAVIPEVYTLNVFFLLGVLWMLRRWTVKGRRRDLFGAALFFGFGAAHHPIVLTLAPVFLLYVLIGVLRGRDPALEVRRLPLVLLLAALPFAVYAYLPLRARAEPFVNWSRPETLDGALSHLRREVYDRAPDVPPPPRTVERTARQAGIFAGRYVREFLPPTLLLVPFGIFLALRRSRRDGALLLLIAGACSLGVIWLTNFDLVYEHIHANSIFWIPTYLVSAVWIGITLEGLASGGLRLPRFATFRFPAWVPPALAGVLLVGTFALHFRGNDRRSCFWAEDYARNVFATLAPDAIYIASGDHNTFPPIYLQRVLGERPDVLLADKYGYFEEHLFEGMSGEARRHRTSLRGDARRRFEEAWLLRRHGARPAYFTQKRDMSDLPGKTVIPVGILFKVIDDTPEAKADALAESEAAWNRYLWRNAPGESMDFTARIIVSERHYARGWFHLLRGESDLALAEFASAVSSESAIKQMWNNAGSALAEYGLLEYAVAFYEGALEIDPSYTPALRNLAACYLDLGYFENVRSHLEPVLREDPGDRAALEILAAAYEREGRFEEAVNVHSDVARRFPEDPTPWVEAGRILLEKAPNPEEARKLLTRALELDPRRMDARTLLAGLDGGKPPSVPEMGPDVALPEGMEGVPNPFSLETPGGLSLPTLPSPRPPEPPLPDPLRGPPR